MLKELDFWKKDISRRFHPYQSARGLKVAGFENCFSKLKSIIQPHLNEPDLYKKDKGRDFILINQHSAWKIAGFEYCLGKVQPIFQPCRKNQISGRWI